VIEFNENSRKPRAETPLSEHLAIEHQCTWHTSKHVLETCQIYSRKRQLNHEKTPKD